MASRSLLRTFVNERLTAVVEEILEVFDGTIAKYEEEAFSSRQEIERLRGLLLEFAPHQNNDSSQLPVCKEETSPEQQQCEQEPSLSLCQKDPDFSRIKEEDQELLAGHQHEEEPSLSHSPYQKKNEAGDTEPPTQPQSQNPETKPQETKALYLMLPLPSHQALVLNEGARGGRERPSAGLISNQAQANLSQTSCTASQESTHNSAAKNCCCHLCDTSFSTFNDLISHACPMNSKDTDFPCALCRESFESTESLNMHLKSHKGLKCCHVCGKNCNSVTALSEHIASHDGVKLHCCHICGKKCSRKGDFKIHMRIHTGEKPYYCSLCCKSFTHSGHLRKHMRSHTGERPHQCDVCGRGFLQSVHLKYHLGTHAQKC
ncbi:zinc finger and BTB domain-containing protein 24-like [Xyrichtys novacula]|uniref:Zinc finger and BTB domain-containing protein 24-like n=1 Tax=Xyrichtys novacula TaxID=13765 RepID=A0AAV1G111_XYRNO|nr:zinc finger and BTB domain-containing protein 24-like [Xyrichtys novacula]